MSSSDSKARASAKSSPLDFIYRYFEGGGKLILKLYNFLPVDIRRSGVHLHPEVFASLVAFVTAVSVVVTIALAVALFFAGLYFAIPLIVLLPFIVFLFMVHLPKLIGSSRAGGVEGEIPFTTSYLSMMVMSGLSPYIAFERIVHASRIFSKSSELSQRFILLVRVMGKDPLTAFSFISERTPSATVRDLLMGYVTTVRAGGDVIDYLTKKARLLFSEILVKMKIAADRLGGLLEAHLAVVLLTLISFTVMYFLTVTYAGYVPFGLSPSSMFLFLYILLPFVSGVVIYLADLIQYKEPWVDWRPYKFFGAVTVPLIAFLTLFGIVLYYSDVPQELKNSILVGGLNAVLASPARLAGLPEYLHASVAFSLALIIATVPAVVYTAIVSHEHEVIRGITRFLRDLVEVRKTGLSPERAIIELSSRNYGVFTKHLKKIAMQLSLGVPLRKIVDELLKKVAAWRAKVLLYVMTDTIEVGGGTIETMENLAWFAESVESIDEERKKSLRTLLIVPYIGGILSAATIILLAAFMSTLQYGVGGYYHAAATTLPAIVLNVYIMGLVAGKVSTTFTAAGFKHAVLLTLVTLLLLALSPAMESLIRGMAQPAT